jgi:uncharacterized protein GlcG (DUF336 family)
MYQKQVLGSEEATKAVQAMISRVVKEQGPPVSVAVVDERGDLLHFARMDGASVNSISMAMCKAYTAAKFRSNTASFRKGLEKQPFGRAELADNMVSLIGGGVVIPKTGKGLETCLGGIGVSGYPTEDGDEGVARIGLEAITD